MNIYIHPYLTAVWITVILARCALTYLVWAERPATCHSFRYYVTASTLRGILLLTASALGWAWTYTWIFWFGQGLLHGLAFATGYACFRHLFYPIKSLPSSFVKPMIAAFSLLFLGVLIFATLYPSIETASRLAADLLTFDRTISIFICGLFWLLSIGSDWLRIPWHRRIYGVGLGFLFCYSVNLFLSTVRAITSWNLTGSLWPVGFTTDLIAVSVWLFYFRGGRLELTALTEDDRTEVDRLLTLFGSREVPKINVGGGQS